VAYSNFDRDPGNVDISDWVASFNVGLNDHIELFFKTNAYRGIKVNNPQNLSSFYLPDSQLYFGATALGVPAAIILAPSGPNVGTLAGTAVFRPPFCPACTSVAPVPNGYYRWGQPLLGVSGFPWTGSTGPNFGLVSLGPSFGFPGFNATLGAPSTVGNRFGGADRFPGIGSPVGSILPGIVLATAVQPATLRTNPIVVPVTFTTAPSYLPDAPFVNRLYGESSFGNFVAGAKWRLTDPRSPFGFGFVPFYRWYADKAGSPGGFNQMQRGSGPGGSIGDFGLVAFADARLSKTVNVSANLGYILNSNPKNGSSTLLDRPDELLAGVGFDFPLNKWFQGIGEFRSTQYVAGHTPNAFQNNPVEFLVGAKIYPARWWGFGAWYRRALNDQRQENFNPKDNATPIVNIANVGNSSVVSTAAGFPNGFQPSSDPYGFGAQLWVGHRNKREPAILPNQPPTASLAASVSTITLPCPAGMHSGTCPTSASTGVSLTTTASDPDGDTLLYSYTVTGGRITGEGANVSWDLSGVGPGTYTASVEVDDGCGCQVTSTATVTIAACSDCVAPPPPCPTVNVSCPDQADPGPVTFTANVGGGPGSQTYNWSVSAGTITSGQGTSSITVNASAGQTITATVELGGLDPSCTRTASCTTSIKPPAPLPRKFDEYGNIRFNDEKARLDNYAIQLQNEPTAQGYIIAYGSCGSEGQERGNRAKDYLVNTRGIDGGRIMVVDGGCMPELKVELWIVPAGATAPAASTEGAVSPCPDCKKKPAAKKPRRHGEE
jgi:hypothetical protein